MKKHLLIFAAFCAAVFVSCTPKELIPDIPSENPGEQVAPEMVTLTITARLDGTKAYIDDEDNYTWKWAEGDQLAVYDAAGTKQILNLTGGADTAVATFSAEVPAGFVPVNGVFPASAAGATAEEYSIPALQTIPAGKSIDPEALVATATSDNGTDFNFTSAVSFLRVTAGNDVARVIIHTNNNPEATMTGASSSVTAVAPASGNYWIAVKPGIYKGIRVFTRTANQVTAGTGRYVSGTADLDLGTPGQGRKLGTLGASDKGTEVYVIETGADLDSFLRGTDAKDAYVVNDLDLTGLTVTARASYSNNFDGQYHSISNWTASNALFAKNAGTIQNVIIDKTCSINWTSAISDQTGIAFIVAKTHTGAVKNCEVAGNITINTDTAGRVFCAGVVGEATTGTVEGCKFSGSIDVTLSGTSQSCSAIAGIVARFGKATATANKVMVSDCENTGSIKFLFSGASGAMKLFGIGGVVGQSVSIKNATNDYGIVQNCINKGKIEWEYPAGGSGSYPALGGVAGIVEGQVKSCENYGTVKYTGSKTVAATDASIGGVVGYVTLGASNCHNHGEIVIDSAFAGGKSMNQSGGNSSWSTFGGVFGNAGPYASDNTYSADKGISVENCSNDAKLTLKCYMVTSGGPQMCFGGVVGVSTANMKSCENKGNVVFETQTKTINAGGVVGFLEADMENCTNSGSVTLNGASVNHPPIDLGDDETAGSSIHSQAYLGGVFGMATSKSKVTNVKNTGAVTLENMYNCGDPANTTYNVLSYVGGINGSYKGGITINDAENTGTITNKADVPVCVGGVSGAFNGTMTNGKNSGPVVNQSSWCSTVDGKQPEVGGIAGYANATFTNCENTGSLTNGPEDGAVGGLVGSFGQYTTAPYEWAGCTVNCDITGNAIAGSVLGKFRSAPSNADAPTQINLGSSESPFTISGGVSSLPLCGSLKGNIVNDVNVVSETPVYRLYVLDEVAMTSWGTGRTIWYSSDAGDIAPAGTKTFGSSTYNYFDLTSDVVGQTIDIYYKSDIVANHCEVKIPLTVSANVTNYYYRTDGVLVGAVTNPSSPEALDATPRIYVRSNGNNLHCHMWGGDSNTSWPGNAFTATSSKEYDALWYYVDLIPNTTQFILNFGGDDGKSGDLTLANYTGRNGSYYLYFYGGSNLGEVL